MNYTLVRSAKRKRSLSLIVKQGELIVRAPRFTPRFLIDQFVASKATWINSQLSEAPAPSPSPNFPDESSLTKYIRSELAVYSQRLQLFPLEVKFREVTSYWGNCRSPGILSFNLALRYAPAPAVTYVVVHELVHLKHQGHGRAFWALVKATYPQTNEMRRTLRQLSHALRSTHHSRRPARPTL